MIEALSVPSGTIGFRLFPVTVRESRPSTSKQAGARCPAVPIRQLWPQLDRLGTIAMPPRPFSAFAE